MYQATTNSAPRGTVENLMMQESSGLTLIPNKLSKPENNTRIRLIPMSDGDGNIYSGLIPDGQVKTPLACLDDSFSYLEIARIWSYGKEVVWLSSILPNDEEGKPVQMMDKSPSRLVIGNYVYKMLSEIARTSKGYPVNLPQHWFDFHDRKVANNVPSSQLLVQAVAYEINGSPLAQPQAGVFCIPDGALPNFEINLLQKIDNNSPLVPGNLVNDAFSPEHGKLLVLQRVDDPTKKGLNNKPKVTYHLQFAQPVPMGADVLRTVYRPWNQVLRFMTINEQIKLLLEYFPPDVVDFGLRRTPYQKYLPDDVRGSSGNIQPETQKLTEIKNMPNYRPDGASLSPVSTAQPGTPVMPTYVPPQQQTQPVPVTQNQLSQVRQGSFPVPPAPAAPPPVTQPALVPLANMVTPGPSGQTPPPVNTEALDRFRRNFAQASAPAAVNHG